MPTTSFDVSSPMLKPSSPVADGAQLRYREPLTAAEDSAISRCVCAMSLTSVTFQRMSRW